MLAKIKLNSIETLISQPLIDLEISHEEFRTIVNEKKYEKMKESVRNTKSSNNLNKEEGKKNKTTNLRVKIMEIHGIKKLLF